MALFADVAAVSLEVIEEFGAPATFSRTTRVEDPATGQSVPSTIPVAGHAMRVKGDPTEYQALGLIGKETVTLLFAATTYGEEVLPGDTVAWPGSAGRPYTAASVNPVGPDGPSIISRVVVSR